MVCEDFPCCGHERGDCEGQLYGSDSSIQNDPHLLCDHEIGECEVANRWADEDYEEPCEHMPSISTGVCIYCGMALEPEEE